MLKVNFSYLKYVDYKYYYEGNLFTGASFKLVGCEIEEFWEFRDGIKTGIYQSKYLPNNPNFLHVNVDCLEFNGEYLASYSSYENQAFSGIAYEIEAGDELCTGEHLIRNGWPVSSVGWDYSGKMQYLGLDSGEFNQNFSWYNNSSLAVFELYSNEFQKRMIHVHLNEEKEIRSIWIEKRYFTWIPQFRDRLEFDYFTNKEDFIGFAVISNFRLYSSGVDDEIFHYLMSNNKLVSVSEIIISDTSLSNQIILRLAGLENLKTITIDDRSRNLIDVVQQLKSERPDCLVKLNSQEI